MDTVRRAIRLIGLSTVFFCTSSIGQIVDGVAAIVNDKVITFSEVKKEVDPTEKLLRDSYKGQELVDKVKEARLNTLRALIERQLIIQDFAKQGFFIPENIIEDRMRVVIARQFDNDRTAFIKTLLANGISLENYKQELREQTIVAAMRQKNVSSAVIVSPYKIEQYYQDNLRQFMTEDQIKLKLIYMKKPLFKEARTNKKGQKEEYDPSMAVMQEILYKLDTGSSFAELAKMYSEGPKREQGGDLGWITRENLRRDLAKVAFALRPGQTSRIVDTDDGYYIMEVDDIKRMTVQPIQEVRTQIEQTVQQEERQRLQQEWLDGLRAKAFIKMF